MSDVKKFYPEELVGCGEGVVLASDYTALEERLMQLLEINADQVYEGNILVARNADLVGYVRKQKDLDFHAIAFEIAGVGDSEYYFLKDELDLFVKKLFS